MNKNIAIDKKTKKINFKDIEQKLKLINRLRNSIMHFENLNMFLLKERTHKINILKKQHSKGEFWFVKNTNENLAIKTFIESKNRQATENKLLFNCNLNELKLGFYIEFRISKQKPFKPIEIDIIKSINWWLK